MSQDRNGDEEERQMQIEKLRSMLGLQAISNIQRRMIAVEQRLRRIEELEREREDLQKRCNELQMRYDQRHQELHKYAQLRKGTRRVESVL
jgi:hypothetical protein